MRNTGLSVLAIITIFSSINFAEDTADNIQWGYFSGGTICLVSSSHQDIAWLDTPGQCETNRDVQTITPALEFMRTEQGYCFAMEQALNLKEYLQRHPELKDEILQRAIEKRFAWGATYTQPYESLESGEQLIRQAYFGRKMIRNILPGADARVAYNVDVPGRAMQMPQILKKAGIDYLVVSRQAEGIFKWTSPDGSSVAVYSNGYYSGPLGTYGNFKCDIAEVISKVSNKLAQQSDYYRKRNLPPVFCIYLCADGLHPVNYSDVCRRWNLLAEEFNKTSPADNKMPRMEHTTAENFMDSVVKPDVKLDTIVGERPNIWLYIHGPTHHWAVSAKRDSGILLPAAEMFATVDSLLAGDFNNYPAKELSDAWEAAVYPDHGWGGKNGDVTDEVFLKKYEFARDQSKAILDKSLQSIAARIKPAGKGRQIVVFNDLSWMRDGIVKVKLNNVKGSFYIADDGGNIMPHQFLHGELSFTAKDIPSIGYKTYYLIEDSNKLMTAAAVGKVITDYENDYYKAEFAQGGIKSIYDKQLNRQLLKTGKFLGGEIFSMQSNGNGAGEFLKVQMPSMEGFDKGSNRSSQWTLVESGRVRDVIETRYSFVDCQIVQRVIFYKDFKNIDFEAEINNWQGRHNREIRMAFPLDLPNGKIAYEVPMGILKVGENETKGAPGGWTEQGHYDQNASEVYPREVQSFITAYNDKARIIIGGGVAVWDYIDPTGNPVDYPVLQPVLLATRKSCHWEGNWYEQKGNHSFKFSLTACNPSDKQYWRTGIESNHFLYAIYDVSRNANTDLPVEKSFFSLSSKNVLISTIKKCEDDNGVVVRVYEIEGNGTNSSLKVPFGISKAQHTNIIEEQGKPLSSNGESIKIKTGKYAIETFKLYVQR
ncbi:MAG: glycoside hydrolase family 38 C-terminal domain-containing protein [Phycisphaerae bacterium]|jgi:alpha-mannosidase